YIKLKDYKKKTKDEGNLIKEYKIRVKEREEELYNYLKNLESQIEENKAQKFKKDNFEIIPIMFDRHLYKPVFYHNVDKVLLHISPFSLQESEYKFMHDLEIFYQQKKDILNGKEIYLLRNMSRGHGLGFFEAGNFYPDFILWVIDKKKQYINFIDPKGIIEIPYNDPKVQFYKDIKEIERELDNVNVILNSFILSISKYSDLRVDKWKSFSQEEIEEFNVLFMEEDYESLYIQKMIAKILPDYPLPRIYKKNTQGEMKFDEKANMAT
ncbi:MAG: hypothetical protein KDK45_21850, partial [Leptospiraceae bacterium]|nr:hypothetical protein [Leptospiraceae bacterium]